jgi:uncharacterized protein YxeA
MNKESRVGRFFFLRQKKAEVSAIAATMIVVMITLLTVIILWMIMISFVRSSMLDRTNCVYIDTALSINKNSEYTCSSDTISKVQVKRKSYEKKIVALEIKYSDGTGESSTQHFDSVPSVNGERVYEIQSKITAASVIAILDVEGENITCGTVDVVPINRKC